MSLLRTAARAAVATRVVGNVQRRQHQQWAAQDAAVAAQQAQAVDDAAARLAATAPAPAAPAPAAAPDMTQVIAQLQQLGQLRDAGVLTDAEFEAQKQRLLGA
ncbi:SHOCT domain-containing protein [Microbacterium sp. OVT16B]|uniref:SHOCT domain-containing protein n=1 Tax=Microbacterium sp. OVT16B TaxID=2862682 RepID=UPI001CBB148B|nr:SHOCT domain-containing protein [Microbacterium sp. OVT16B]